MTFLRSYWITQALQCKERILKLESKLHELKVQLIRLDARDPNAPHSLERLERRFKTHEGFIRAEMSFLKQAMDKLEEYPPEVLN